MSRHEGMTLFMTLLAAFQTLLYRISGKKDIVLGTDIANRTSSETERMIGFFVNLLALRGNFSGQPTFREVLLLVRETVLGAYTYQDIPFELLVDDLKLERQSNRTPLINVLFVFQNVPTQETEFSDLTLSPFHQDVSTVKFDLAIFLSEKAGSLRGAIHYDTDLFEEETIAQLMRRYEVLLQSVVAQPDASIDALEIYPAEEKQQQARRLGNRLRKLKSARREQIDLGTLSPSGEQEH